MTITQRTGRIGQQTEYVEFKIEGHKRAPRFVAQKGSGGYWFVFEVHPGTKGKVVTMYSSPDKAKAVQQAEGEAKALAERLK